MIQYNGKEWDTAEVVPEPVQIGGKFAKESAIWTEN